MLSDTIGTMHRPSQVSASALQRFPPEGEKKEMEIMIASCGGTGESNIIKWKYAEFPLRIGVDAITSLRTWFRLRGTSKFFPGRIWRRI